MCDSLKMKTTSERKKNTYYANRLFICNNVNKGTHIEKREKGGMKMRSI